MEPGLSYGLVSIFQKYNNDIKLSAKIKKIVKKKD